MPSCDGCGSGISETQVICEFCGQTLRAVSDPIEEAKAVLELGRAWAKVGQSSASAGPLKGLIANHPLMAINKAKGFWSSAFMPTTLEGLLVAGEQALGLIRPDAQIMDAAAMEMNKLIRPRLETIIELCELKGAGDPRVEALKRVANRKLAALSKGRFRAWRNWGLMILAFFLFFGGVLFFLPK